MTAERQTVAVSLAERAYRIEIGTGNLPELARFALELRPWRHAIVITDDHLQGTHAETAVASLDESGIQTELLVIEPGEESKSVEVVSTLWEKLLELGADRKTLIVAVGGGVIGDLAGFAAAGFARGIPLLQVPTTLLAQVDSSVGGKVGVNLPGAKNMVGAFWQPCGVLIDTAVLETLPDREYRSGLAEVVKYGVILDESFFEWLEANTAAINARDNAVLRRIVARCCELKADVVRQDEREETGLRAVLNYGHTFCHAFETLTGYQTLLHGEAVAMGMICASRLAADLGRIPPVVTERQAALLTALGLSLAPPPLDTAEVLQVMARDKKAEQGKLRFVLPTRLGHVELVDGVPAEAVRRALHAAK